MIVNPLVLTHIATFHPEESVRTKAGNLLVNFYEETIQLRDPDLGFPEILEIGENDKGNFTNATAIYAGKVFVDLLFRRGGIADVSIVEDIANDDRHIRFRSEVRKYARERLGGMHSSTNFESSFEKIRELLENPDKSSDSRLSLARLVARVATKYRLNPLKKEEITPPAHFRRNPVTHKKRIRQSV